MNNWTVVGRTGRDFDLKWLDSGKAVASTSLAVDKIAKEKEDRTLWIKVEAWGKAAENLAQYVKKGHQVALSGRADIEEWQDKQGATRLTLKLVVNEFKLLNNDRGESGGEKPQIDMSGGKKAPF